MEKFNPIKTVKKGMEFLKKLDSTSLESTFGEKAKNNPTLRHMLDNVGKVFSKDQLEEQGLTEFTTYTTNDSSENLGAGTYSMYDKDGIRYVFKVESAEQNSKLYHIVDLTTL